MSSLCELAVRMVSAFLMPAIEGLPVEMLQSMIWLFYIVSCPCCAAANRSLARGSTQWRKFAFGADLLSCSGTALANLFYFLLESVMLTMHCSLVSAFCSCLLSCYGVMVWFQLLSMQVPPHQWIVL